MMSEDRKAGEDPPNRRSVDVQLHLFPPFRLRYYYKPYLPELQEENKNFFGFLKTFFRLAANRHFRKKKRAFPPENPAAPPCLFRFFPPAVRAAPASAFCASSCKPRSRAPQFPPFSSPGALSPLFFLHFPPRRSFPLFFLRRRAGQQKPREAEVLFLFARLSVCRQFSVFVSVPISASMSRTIAAMACSAAGTVTRSAAALSAGTAFPTA